MPIKSLNFDVISAVIFILVMALLIIKNKKKIQLQKIIFPLIYALLWRTKIGLNFMERAANKYREIIKLIGYCMVGFGFVGLIYVSINILFLLFSIFAAPKQASQQVALVLPFTNVPGIGFLSFWYFIIGIFIIALVHEFAHGIMARAHHVPLKSSGLAVFSIVLPIFPAAFVEPDERKMQKEADIVQYSVLSAGPMANIILAFLILLLLPYVANPAALAPFESTITQPLGISYTGLTEGYAAQEAGMLPGTIINGVNGKETLDFNSFTYELRYLRPNETIKISTSNGTYTLTAKASEEDPAKGLIGIQGIANERRVKPEYEKIKKPYYWLKGMLKWLFYLNFLIGLMNLLPLVITDGGRMLKVALEKLIPNKKKANKAALFVGFLFIFTILLALAIRYGLGLLNVLGI